MVSKVYVLHYLVMNRTLQIDKDKKKSNEMMAMTLLVPNITTRKT